jgi:predicted Fe-Mo cluster-binding NifX family protein
MRIAVSANGDDIESLTDPLFGRCPYFIVVNPADMSFEAFTNPHVNDKEMCGILSARFVASKGVSVVICGHCGPAAAKELTRSNIKMFTSMMGTVRQAVDRYREGNLLSTDKANVEKYFGKRCRQTEKPDK